VNYPGEERVPPIFFEQLGGRLSPPRFCFQGTGVPDRLGGDGMRLVHPVRYLESVGEF